MLLSERNANDGDVEQHAEKHMGQPYPDATDEEPDEVHDCVKATVRLLLFTYHRAERP